MTLMVFIGTANACNRYYTTTENGQFLTRLNRRNGNTKTIGKWQAGNTEDRIIDTLEWNFPEQTMYGLELNAKQPNRAQRFVRVNRQKPRGDNINNVTFGLTDRRDLHGMAIDGEDIYYVHAMDDQSLWEVDPNTGM